MNRFVSIHRRHHRAGDTHNRGGEPSGRDHVIRNGRQPACGEELVERLELLDAREVTEFLVAAQWSEVHG
jgi:hypothetical protein